MYLRLSAELAAKVKQSPGEILPLHENHLRDWSAQCFRAGRVQYVLLSNTTSLYSTVFPARGITNSGRLFEAAVCGLRECLEDDGLHTLGEQILALDRHSVQFSKSLNRRVTGSMNDLIRHAKFQIADRLRYPREAAALLNTIPFSALGHRKPREALAAAADLVIERRPMGYAMPGKVLQFKIVLRGCDPPIWRRIQMADGTLDQLHENIQLAMGWTNSHLHQFVIGGACFGDPLLLEEDYYDARFRDSTRTRLTAVLPADGKPLAFDYQYDFGDSWDHEILFEGFPPAANLRYPVCLEGAHVRLRTWEEQRDTWNL